MESYFNQSLAIAIVIAAVYWIGFLAAHAADGGGSLSVYLFGLLFITIILLVINLISSDAALIVSAIFHSFMLIVTVYQAAKAIFASRNNFGNK